MGHEQSWDRWWGQHARVYTKFQQHEHGAEYVEQLVGELREFMPNFAPRRILEFGCGLGRIMLPLAQAFPQAHSVGVDISDEAIGQARARLAPLEGQTSFVNSSVTEIQGGFDLLHSFIVFQHIPVKVGLKRFAELVSKLNPNGVGAVHFAYSHSKSLSRRMIYHARRWLPGAHIVANAFTRGPPLPFVQMNAYPLNQLFRILQDGGCHRIGTRFSDHEGYLGVRLMFHKNSLPTL